MPLTISPSRKYEPARSQVEVLSSFHRCGVGSLKLFGGAPSGMAALVALVEKSAGPKGRARVEVRREAAGLLRASAERDLVVAIV